MALDHFESSKHEYAQTLLYPEICLARIPFLCPVPTAISRAVSIQSFNIPATGNGTVGWSFIPEALTNSQY